MGAGVLRRGEKGNEKNARNVQAGNKMKGKHSSETLQSGVIPYRIQDGKLEVMIVTTSSHKSWTIPKGNIAKGMTASESAAKEAYEEAGIRGEIVRPNIGFYNYEKHSKKFKVKVFLLEVTEILAEWPEYLSRKRRWSSIRKAHKKVGHIQLKDMLVHLEQNFEILP